MKYIIKCKGEVIDGGLSAEVENKIPITGKERNETMQLKQSRKLKHAKRQPIMVKN